MSRTLKTLLVYACLSAVYLLYLPHALPVLDDWTNLQMFDQARGSGISGSLLFLHRIADNTSYGRFRLFWASYVAAYGFSFVAGFAAWAYCLLAWIVHLITAFLLCRTVSLLGGDAATAFLAGALYSAFPAANNGLFWPLPEYYLQAAVLLWWFQHTWRKLAVCGDYRYRWKDAAALCPAVFCGEHILAAVALLLPVTGWLFADRAKRRDLLRFWAAHVAVMAILLGLYAGLVNRAPIGPGLASRYSGGSRWSPWPFAARLLASLGLNPGLAEWRPEWRIEPALVALLALAAVAFLGGLPKGVSRGAIQMRLLAWSAAGVLLTYAPTALLPGFEWRYLYVPAAFLVMSGVAVLGLLRAPIRNGVVFLAVAYGLTLSYFEMRQCWMPQSREARAILEAVASAKPVEPGEVLIFSRALYSIGPAPSFIAGASWSLKAMLEHTTGAAQVRGARELLVNENGDLALYNRDRVDPFAQGNLSRLRVFVREPDGRFLPKPWLALSVSGERFRLIPLRPNLRRSVPLELMTRDELERLPFSRDIYFAHPHSGTLPGVVPHA